MNLSWVPKLLKALYFLGYRVSLMSKGPEITVSYSQVKCQSWFAPLLSEFVKV